MTTLAVLGIILAALLGAPLFSIFGAAALFGFHSSGVNTEAVIIQMTQLVSAPALVAIPLFTFAGYMMAESGAPQRLVRLTEACFGWMPGGLALVTMFACAFFTAFTGASGVTIIALGGLLYPILKKRGYSESFSLGIVTCCGSLGLLFPPSLPIILYGVIGQVDVDKLFIAGILPGILLIVLLSLYSMIAGSKTTSRVKFRWKEAAKAIRIAAWELPLPLIVLFGVYGGYTTASEAAAVCAFYVFVVEVFIYKDLSLTKDVPRVMRDSMVLVGGILIIVAVALGFTNFIIDQEVPMKLFALTKQYINSNDVPGGLERLPPDRRVSHRYLFRHHCCRPDYRPDRHRIRRQPGSFGDHLFDQPRDRLHHSSLRIEPLPLELPVQTADREGLYRYLALPFNPGGGASDYYVRSLAESGACQ